MHNQTTESPDSSPAYVQLHEPMTGWKCSPAYVKRRESMEQGKANGISVDENECTTVNLRNIPRHYTLFHLSQELSELGVVEGIDFIKLFEDAKQKHRNRGYAFLNFCSHEQALRCLEAMDGHLWKWTEDTATVVHRGLATWAVIQGFEANNAKHPGAAILGLALAGINPTIATNPCTLETLFGQSAFTATLYRPPKCRGRKRRNTRIQEMSMHRRDPDKQKCSPAYVQLHEPMEDWKLSPAYVKLHEH